MESMRSPVFSTVYWKIRDVCVCVWVWPGAWGLPIRLKGGSNASGLWYLTKEQ